MKKLILSILFLFLFNLCSAQIVQFKAYYLNMRFFNDTIQTFNNWEGWEETDTPIDMDIKKMVLIIYSEYEQVYDIIDVLYKEEDSLHRETAFKAFDKEKGKCIIKMVIIKPTNQNFIHVIWKNLELAYEIEKL